MMHYKNKYSNLGIVGLFLIVLMMHSSVLAQDSLVVTADSNMVMSVDSNMVVSNDSLSILEANNAMNNSRYKLNKVHHSEINKGKGMVRIIQDERINTLDRIIKNNPYEHEGFRIQVVFGSQSVVNSKQASFQNKFSYRTYKDFLAPNFRLRAGDFATKQLAEKHLYRIRQSFPDAYIVKDKINTPSEYR